MAEAEKKMNEQDVEETAKASAENTEEAAAETGGEESAGTEQAGTEEASAQETPAEDTKTEDKGLNGKSKAMQEKVAALEDKVKRQMAEFDNFRKRTAKEKEQMFSMGERNVIEKMLPVVDNFERGLAAVTEAEKDSALASGMEMIYKQLCKQLEDLGVKPIEAVGKEFDPNFHNAVMQVASDEYESGVVAQEFLKGYTYHDTVIRHSMVGVVQ